MFNSTSQKKKKTKRMHDENKENKSNIMKAATVQERKMLKTINDKTQEVENIKNVLAECIHLVGEEGANFENIKFKKQILDPLLKKKKIVPTTWSLRGVKDKGTSYKNEIKMALNDIDEESIEVLDDPEHFFMKKYSRVLGDHVDIKDLLLSLSTKQEMRKKQVEKRESRSLQKLLDIGATGSKKSKSFGELDRLNATEALAADIDSGDGDLIEDNIEETSKKPEDSPLFSTALAEKVTYNKSGAGKSSKFDLIQETMARQIKEAENLKAKEIAVFERIAANMEEKKTETEAEVVEINIKAENQKYAYPLELKSMLQVKRETLSYMGILEVFDNGEIEVVKNYANRETLVKRVTSLATSKNVSVCLDKTENVLIFKEEEE